jgi:hypothetical protein
MDITLDEAHIASSGARATKGVLYKYQGETWEYRTLQPQDPNGTGHVCQNNMLSIPDDTRYRASDTSAKWSLAPPLCNENGDNSPCTPYKVISNFPWNTDYLIISDSNYGGISYRTNNRDAAPPSDSIDADWQVNVPANSASSVTMKPSCPHNNQQILLRRRKYGCMPKTLEQADVRGAGRSGTTRMKRLKYGAGLNVYMDEADSDGSLARAAQHQVLECAGGVGYEWDTVSASWDFDQQPKLYQGRSRSECIGWLDDPVRWDVPFRDAIANAAPDHACCAPYSYSSKWCSADQKEEHCTTKRNENWRFRVGVEDEENIGYCSEWLEV